MSRQTRDIIKCTTLLMAVFGLILFTIGCPSHNASQEISTTGTHIAKADAYVEGAIPHTDKNGKPLLNSARVELGAADKSNQAAASENAALVKERDHWKEKYDTLNHSLPVVIYRWIVRLLLVVSLLGIGAFALHTFFGGTIWGSVGTWVLRFFHLLPIPNPFPAADATVAYLRRRKGVSV